MQDLTIHKPAFKAYDYNWAPRLTLSQVRLHKRSVRQSYTSTRLIEKGRTKTSLHLAFWDVHGT
ncbi:hypothetical protein K457DRAFT_1875247 [Linnemannia elongata AG-77]|uniref:Uncharacterized protein n=1 Tax=Linnemannia elongata AG-77 TaxID=1314771 RepID=A0A197K1J3_9FUNG|nr:hypothetical protein K457DRAFT_1875247 [Linnemannia elongata AG-77]